MNLYKIVFTMFVLIMMLSAIGCASTTTATASIAAQKPGRESTRIIRSEHFYHSRSCSTWRNDQVFRPTFAGLVSDAQSNLVSYVCGNKADGAVKDYKIAFAGNDGDLLCAEIRVDPKLVICNAEPSKG